MHWIQSHILHELSRTTSRRYRDLRPVLVEGNTFVHHLKQLVTVGYVSHKGQLYSLTPQGLQYVDRMSKENLQPRIQPKIVTLAAVRAGEQWLLYRRQRQPFVGKVGFPYGKLHVGESVVAAAERELREKTGVSAELVHAGDGYLLVRDSRGGVVSHMLMHIMVGELSEVVMLGDERHALQSCFWGHAAMLDDAMPGFSEILATVSVWKAGDARFFLELDVQG